MVKVRNKSEEKLGFDLVDCKVGGFPRDRSDDSINALDEAINFQHKRIKAANEPAFKAGDGCYGEDEDYQAGNIKSGTIEKMAIKCTQNPVNSTS